MATILRCPTVTKGSAGTPAGRRTSLLVCMGNAARDAGVVPRRIHLVVAIDRLLVRLLEAAPGRWVVKGGYANQLRRPDAARFTEDLDLKIDAAIETAPELLASDLRVIAETCENAAVFPGDDGRLRPLGIGICWGAAKGPPAPTVSAKSARRSPRGRRGRLSLPPLPDRAGPRGM